MNFDLKDVILGGISMIIVTILMSVDAEHNQKLGDLVMLIFMLLFYIIMEALEVCYQFIKKILKNRL